MSAPTAVIFHDTSYRHRYSRPNTSLQDLATIVERPERIPAATLGVAAAQTRVGRSRLSIRKSERMGSLLDPEVMLVHCHAAPVRGAKSSWPEDLAAMCGAAAEKLKKGECEVPKGYHQGDLYLCEESKEDLEGCLGALYDGVDLVFGGDERNGTISEDDQKRRGVRRAFVCIRPPGIGHHCAETQPSGFCWLNNVHIAIAHAARAHGLSHAVILDFDLHHGDGSQAIAWTLNELAGSTHNTSKRTSGIQVPNIGYFSLHDINSYPCEYGDIDKIKNASLNLNAHGQCIQNVHLAPYSTEGEFWTLYNDKYSSLLTKAREFLSVAAVSKPKKSREFKAGVFLSAGFDASEHEGAGMQRHAVNVPTSFFARFTSDAVALAEEYCHGRVLSVLEGGYSDRALTTGVFAHMAGLACAPPEATSTYVSPSLGLTPLHKPLENSGLDRGWDAEWWGMERVLELEGHFARMTAKKPNVERASTSYLSPTAASVAKKNDVPRRVMSNGYLDGNNNSGPPPPPPVIPWEVAAFDLSRMIVPEYRESVEIPPIEKPTKRSARHSVIGVVDPDSTRMTLRDRKPKPAPGPSPDIDRGRRRMTTTGILPDSAATSRAPSRAVSRAPSRAPSKAPSRPPSRAQRAGAPSRGVTPIPPSRGTTPAPGGRQIGSTSGGGVTVAGPRKAVVKKPSVIGTDVSKRVVDQHPVTAVQKTSSTISSASSVASSPTGSQEPMKTGCDDDVDSLTKGMFKVKLTYKNRDKDRAEQLRILEQEKERTEQALETEKRRLATNHALKRKEGGVGRMKEAFERNLTGTTAAGSHAEKETKMVDNVEIPVACSPMDQTFHGGDIKFADPWQGK
ncbi:Histone deacetylase HOS3 [Tuber indicum]|nr:Histone deacetylase HOS3 [Tuber indicum]